MIQHCFFILSGPKFIEVKLSNDVAKKHSNYEGTYVLESNLISERPYWSKGEKAIWFNPIYHSWNIGRKENLGTSRSAIASFCIGPEMLPHKVRQWYVYQPSVIISIVNDKKIEIMCEEYFEDDDEWIGAYAYDVFVKSVEFDPNLTISTGSCRICFEAMQSYQLNCNCQHVFYCADHYREFSDKKCIYCRKKIKLLP